MPKAPIPHSRPTLGEEEAQAAAEAVRSGQIAQGPRVAAFEEAVARYAGRAGGVAASSGTAALQLALHAMGVGPGDTVVVPAYNCPALVHAVRHLGARVRLCDVDPSTGNPTPETVGVTVRGARAVILAHLFGAPAEGAVIAALGVPVVEDLAQALGAAGPEGPVGRAGKLSICSFYATKPLAAGEGGMVLGDDAELLARARDARDYDERDDLSLRWNHKLTDVQAAIGLVQLSRYEGFIARRRTIAARYAEGLAGTPMGLPREPAGGRHIFHRYVVRLPEGFPVEKAIEALEAEGIAARRPIYRPLHMLMGEKGFPGAEEAWTRHLSLPIYPSLTEPEIERIMGAMRLLFRS